MIKKFPKLENFLSIVSIPLTYALALGMMAYVERDEPKQGEFKRINANEIKTLVSNNVMGVTADTYNFKTDSVSRFNAFGSPRRGAFSHTNQFSFNDLKDTTDLHIARQMQLNNFSFAKKAEIEQTITVPHTLVQIVDNKDTIQTKYNTYIDTSYIKHEYKR